MGHEQDWALIGCLRVLRTKSRWHRQNQLRERCELCRGKRVIKGCRRKDAEH